MKTNTTNLILFLVVGALVYFPLFLHIDVLPLKVYDESRLAVNAVEMLESGNLLVTTFEGKPDMWNTKPPLMIMLQAAFMKLIGINELAVRLPAALAGLATVVLLFFFSRKHFKSVAAGIITVLVLVTTKGYVTEHVTRTGDYDVLLTLFNLAGMLAFYYAIETENKQRQGKYLLLTAICATFAVLTKSVVGLMFFPAFFVYALIHKKLLLILKNKYLYFSILVFIIPVLSYYLLRETYNPGYLQAIFDNELGGRYLETLEDHKAPFYWYFNEIASRDFTPWIMLLPFSLVLGLTKSAATRRLTILCSLVALSFLLIISMGQTKLDWYESPVYPILSLLAMFPLLAIYEHFKKYKIIGFFLMISVFAAPYWTIVQKSYLPKPAGDGSKYGLMLRDTEQYKKIVIAQLGYNSHVNFYKKMYDSRGQEIIRNHPEYLSLGDIVLFCEQNVKDIIDKKYEYTSLQEKLGCRTIRIDRKKE